MIRAEQQAKFVFVNYATEADFFDESNKMFGNADEVSGAKRPRKANPVPSSLAAESPASAAAQRAAWPTIDQSGR